MQIAASPATALVVVSACVAVGSEVGSEIARQDLFEDSAHVRDWDIHLCIHVQMLHIVVFEDM